MNALPVSVVLPAYQGAATLPRALSSVSRQRPQPPGEIIIVDDGSTDDVESIARAWGALVLRHVVNRGVGAARNTGINAASYRWVALLDCDDEWLPDHLASLWPLRGNHDVVAGAVMKIGRKRQRYDGALGTTPRIIRRPEELLFPECFIRPSATLLRTEAVLTVGGYDPALRLAQDLDLVVRMLGHGSAVCSPEVTTVWYEREGQASEDRHSMRLAHLAIVEREAPASQRAQLARRCRAVTLWDNLRSSDPLALRARAAARLVADPRHVVGLLALWKWRWRIRRASVALGGKTASGHGTRN